MQIISFCGIIVVIIRAKIFALYQEGEASNDYTGDAGRDKTFKG